MTYSFFRYLLLVLMVVNLTQINSNSANISLHFPFASAINFDSSNTFFSNKFIHESYCKHGT